MNRFLASVLLASAVGISLGACGDDDSDGGYVGAYGGGGDGVDCSPYSTCGTCTPVLGCGWCFHGGVGGCVSDPDSCDIDASEFTWTWNPSGCPDVDAAVVPLDASPAREASAQEAATGSE